MKRVYIIESAYVWEYDSLIREYPQLLKYFYKKIPINMWSGVHYGMLIKIDDSQIIELCNEFECKSIVIDFNKNLYSEYDYPNIIIYDNYIE